MKAQTIKAYCCEYCSKISRAAGAMAKHERFCKKNPHNHALCYKCEHFKQAEFEVFEHINVTVGEGDVQTFIMSPNRCEKQQIKVFNGLKWNSRTLNIFLSQGTYKMMPSIADGCQYFEQFQEPPTIDVDKIRLQTQKENIERMRRDVTKYFDID